MGDVKNSATQPARHDPTCLCHAGDMPRIMPIPSTRYRRKTAPEIAPKRQKKAHNFRISFFHSGSFRRQLARIVGGVFSGYFGSGSFGSVMVEGGMIVGARLVMI
jgi:hypothetical protein